MIQVRLAQQARLALLALARLAKPVRQGILARLVRPALLVLRGPEQLERPGRPEIPEIPAPLERLGRQVRPAPEQRVRLEKQEIPGL